MEPPLPYRIEIARDEDITRWREHTQAHRTENGRDGIYFMPASPTQSPSTKELERVEAIRAAVAKSLEEPGWLRVFLLTKGDGAIVGHADLTGGAIASELHRCRLGMGLREGHRRRGLGRALLTTAIEFARSAGLAWMDLGVFDRNAPAIALYRNLGFVEIGRTPDRFRVDAVSITDIEMALDLRSGGSETE